MTAKIYFETSVVSYLTARLSNDLIVAAHQKITQEWWENHSSQLDFYVSRFVIEEASAGDPNAAKKRLDFIAQFPLLDLTDEVLNLANQLLKSGILPPKAHKDVAHIAIATCHGMDYLLTWNCKHIANATKRNDMIKFCDESGYQCPILCTPQDLIMGE